MLYHLGVEGHELIMENKYFEAIATAFEITGHNRQLPLGKMVDKSLSS